MSEGQTAAPASAGASAVPQLEAFLLVEAALRGHFHGDGYSAPGHSEDRDECWHCHEGAQVAAEAVARLLPLRCKHCGGTGMRRDNVDGEVRTCVWCPPSNGSVEHTCGDPRCTDVDHLRVVR